jgi:hypothetical protein
VDFAATIFARGETDAGQQAGWGARDSASPSRKARCVFAVTNTCASTANPMVQRDPENTAARPAVVLLPV